MERRSKTTVVKQLSDNAVLQWRILGACTCNAVAGMIILIIFSTIWGISSLLVPPMRGGVGIQSWAWWLMGAAFQAALIPATAAYVITLQNNDTMISIGSNDRYVPVVIASRLIKLAGRLSTAEGCFRQGIALVLRLFSGIISLDLLIQYYPCGRHDMSFSHVVVLALACDIVYHMHCIFWSRDVLVFPNVTKHRWYRWKDRLVPICQRMVPISVLSYFVYAMLMQLTGGAAAHDGSRAGWILSVVVYSSMLLLLWSLGDSMTDIIMSERLRIGDYDSKKVLEAMQDCLDGKRGDLMQMLALYDLSLIPSDGDTNKKAMWRMREIFADDSGATWSRVASLCTDILAGIIYEVEKLEEISSKLKAASASSKAGSFQPTKWNTIPTGGALKHSAIAADALECLLQVAGYHQSLVLSIRFLSDMAYVSVEEDTYGVLQLSEPSLGDIVFTLVRLEQKIRHLSQWTVGFSSTHGLRWRASGEELYSFRRSDGCLEVVKSEIHIALENLGSKFGLVLLDTLESNAQYTGIGNTAEKQHLRGQLASFCGSND